jgi:peptidyl-prolyl cis-trans isomerase C
VTLTGRVRTILREPISYFLILGLVLYLSYGWLNPDYTTNSRVISVDRDSLMRFIQFRTQSFTDNAGEKLDSLSSDALADIIRQYIQEEALYRQAMAYGMAKDDYVIKRRMVQKMEFLAEGTRPAVTSLTTSELETYYEEHREGYKLPAAVTFTHVFFSAERHGDAVDKLAKETLGILSENRVRFDQAPNYGDRFPYQLNYVERTQEEVASHFGEEMAQAVFRLQPEKARWQGPIRSEFGVHLVLLTRAEAARIPSLNEVSDQLASELQRSREVERKQNTIDKLIDDFEIRLSPEFEGVTKR